MSLVITLKEDEWVEIGPAVKIQFCARNPNSKKILVKIDAPPDLRITRSSFKKESEPTK